MPIRASERARYPKNWKEISIRVREREGQRCKWCGAPNGKLVLRDRDANTWRLHVHDGVCAGELCRATLIVLTVAHLNHKPEDVSEGNLAALCQRCHLGYDQKQHIEQARITRETKSGQLRLLPR